MASAARAVSRNVASGCSRSDISVSMREAKSWSVTMPPYG